MSIKARIAAGAVLLVSGSVIGFLGDWEGRGKTVYADKLAGGLPTACGGITKHTSPVPVVVGDVWTDEMCHEIIGSVVVKTQTRLADCLVGDIKQHEFDALTSHAHNFGVGATCSSRAVQLINAGQKREGCLALSQTPDGKPNWSSVKTGRILANGHPERRFVQGLHNRRKAETKMCLGDGK